MSSRTPSLDLIRGVAILGILFMNIMAMAAPWEAYFSPVWREGLSSWELPLFHMQSVLFESRFMSLFSLLFGAGLYIQYQSALRQGLAAKPRIYARLRWLFVFGLLHGFLLFVGDILTLYACCGFVVFRFLGSSSRKQVVLVIVFLLIGQVTLLGILASPFLAGESLMTSTLPLTESVVLSEQRLWTTYPSRLEAQASEYVQTLFAIPMSQIWHNMALMLIGVLLYKRGFFHQARWWPSGAVCLGLGLLLGGLIQVLRGYMGWETDAGLATSPLMMLAGLLSAIGYIAILVGFAHRSHWFIDCLKQAGKMAFTLYIAQSFFVYILFVWLVPHFWGALGRPELLSLVAVLTILQLWFANFWQQRFGAGPLERLWRYLAYQHQEEAATALK